MIRSPLQFDVRCEPVKGKRVVKIRELARLNRVDQLLGLWRVEPSTHQISRSDVEMSARIFHAQFEVEDGYDSARFPIGVDDFRINGRTLEVVTTEPTTNKTCGTSRVDAQIVAAAVQVTG